MINLIANMIYGIQPTENNIYRNGKNRGRGGVYLSQKKWKTSGAGDTQTKDLRYTELDIQLVMNITSDFFRVILINFTIERERSYKKNFPPKYGELTRVITDMKRVVIQDHKGLGYAGKSNRIGLSPISYSSYT